MMIAIQGRSNDCQIDYHLTLINIVPCSAVNFQDENSLHGHLVKLQTFSQILKEVWFGQALVFNYNIGTGRHK